MQQQLMKQQKNPAEDTSEVVKAGNVELPKLPEYKPESAPIDLDDWLCLLEPIMADLSDSSQTWWGKVMESAKEVPEHGASGAAEAAPERS